jgi:hypothetical protein
MIWDFICSPVDYYLCECRDRILTRQHSSRKRTSKLQDDKKIPLYPLFKKIVCIYYVLSVLGLRRL